MAEMTSVLAIDLGLQGAMALVRCGLDGPEVVAVHTWRTRTHKGHQDHHDVMLCWLRDLRPDVVATEEPISIPGRRYVGVAQAHQAGVVRALAEERGFRVVEVPRQDEKAARYAWFILRESVAEVFGREEAKRWSGSEGEHVKDAMAISLAALAREREGAART
jgi:hypothetical protein